MCHMSGREDSFKLQKAQHISPEMIEAFLEEQAQRGRKDASLCNYRRILRELYRYLPADKCIREETGAAWKSCLEGQGLQPATVNTRISVWNSFLNFLGHREWQMEDFERKEGKAKPGLSRAEYLRLLSAAKQAGKERTYLLIKLFGGAGLRIQEVLRLTAEDLRQDKETSGAVDSKPGHARPLPEGLRQEMLDYIRRERISQGPVFCTREGTPMTRSNVNYLIGLVSREAQVEEEKVTPSSLHRMYRETYGEIQAQAAVLVEEAYQRLLEEEQRAAGWM